jgi:hypothetical protein
MTKQKLVEVLVQQIMKEVSTNIREIVREEIDIERKRVKKQLLEELREKFTEEVHVTKAPKMPMMEPLVKKRPMGNKVIDTGDDYINEILADVKVTEEDQNAFKDITRRLTPTTTSFQNATKQASQVLNESRSTGLYKPPEGEGINFDPTTMNPAQIDWSSFVDLEPPLKNIPPPMAGVS